jgi:hypothetical protein
LVCNNVQTVAVLWLGALQDARWMPFEAPLQQKPPDEFDVPFVYSHSQSLVPITDGTISAGFVVLSILAE